MTPTAQESIWKCAECGNTVKIFNIYHDVLTGKPRTGIHLKCEDKDHRGIERVFIEDDALVSILANHELSEGLILKLRHHSGTGAGT